MLKSLPSLFRHARSKGLEGGGASLRIAAVRKVEAAVPEANAAPSNDAGQAGSSREKKIAISTTWKPGDAALFQDHEPCVICATYFDAKGKQNVFVATLKAARGALPEVSLFRVCLYACVRVCVYARVRVRACAYACVRACTFPPAVLTIVFAVCDASQSVDVLVGWPKHKFALARRVLVPVEASELTWRWVSVSVRLWALNWGFK